jgi:hypothetical protein
MVNYRVPVHKGIAMSVHEFSGVIEVVRSFFAFNVHFIPEFRQWYQPSQGYGIGLGIQELGKFLRNVQTTSSSLHILKEFRLGICDLETQADRTLLETVLTQEEDVEDLYDHFEMASPIVISRPSSRITFIGNNFE